MPVCAKQRILHHVFRVFGVTTGKKAETKRHFLRAHQQRLHGTGVAVGSPTNECRIIGGTPIVFLQ